jgi:NADH-dependent peroxiredoxin subunit F
MLDANLKTQLAGYLERLTNDVEISACLDESPAATELRSLLGTLAGLSPRIRLVERTPADGVAAGLRRPSFSVARLGAEPRVHFAGVPLGHEFTSLVLALLQAGGVAPKADPALLEAARAIDTDLVFETFVSLSCQNCPDVVQALNLLAAVNPRIRHTMIDGALHQEEVARREILAVPSVVLNGAPFGQGRMSLKEIIARVRPEPAEGRAQRLESVAPYDLLIVGGGPAGAAAAIYAARKGVRTAVVAERFGGQVLDTMGIENFVSVTATEGPALAQALENHVRSYGVEIIDGERAASLVRRDYLELGLEGGATLRARSLVIATGARWREMNVPGEREYRNRGVAYCPHCDGPLFRGKPVAVIGGGNSGVEAAIDLAGLASHVTLLEYDERLRADAVLRRKLAELPNVTVLTSAQTLAVDGDGRRVTGLRYRDRTTDAEHALALDGIFVQIGLVPNTDWLKGTLELSPRGEIKVDSHGETSLSGVYAAGDCTTVPYKQIVIAVGDGARAALGAFDHLIRLPVGAAA